jgi:predicted dehydrogenase
MPLALECLGADVNVLVEKPLGLSLSEIDTLIAGPVPCTGVPSRNGP